jgi:AcrR family transcriptional regulator
MAEARPGARTPRQARAVETRQRVLDAAEKLLARTAPGGVTTRAVAEEAGVPVGTVYRYFANAEGMLTALFDRFNAPTLEALAHPLEAEDWRENVRRVFAVVRRAHERHPAYGALMTALGRQGGDGEIGSLIAARLREARAGLREDEAGLVARITVAMVEATERLVHERPSEERGALFAEGEKAVLAYLAEIMEGAGP